MIVLTLGTFDIPHYGHYKLIQKCKAIANGDDVVIGLNTDEFIEKYKGKKPVLSYREREEFLLAWDVVVIPNNQTDGTIKNVLVQMISDPEIIVIGSDWLRKDYLKQIGLTPEFLEEKNISLMYVPYTKGISTTELKERLKKHV
jgi:glycerol-3-phosphate cytidylyltransferase